jgi:GT2 family glycosyltransferase
LEPGAEMPQCSLGVVTVTYNSAPFLDEFVASCSRQLMQDFRVYCVDNKSSDNTADYLSNIRDERWVISLNSDNRGVAAANNQGIVRALRDNCEWILLLNNDTSFDENFFETLISACRSEAWLAAVPKIHFDTPRDHIWYGGGGFDRLKGFTGYHVGMGELDVGQCDTSMVVEYAPTCAMLVHRTVFETVGLMDEAYFVYFDDTDFCWRLRRAGIALGYVPRTKLIHKVGGSTGGDRKPFTVGYTSRNRLYYLKKHFGSLAAIAWRPFFLIFYVYRYFTGWWTYPCLTASFKGSFAYRKMRTRVPNLEEDLQRDSSWFTASRRSG